MRRISFFISCVVNQVCWSRKNKNRENQNSCQYCFPEIRTQTFRHYIGHIKEPIEFRKSRIVIDFHHNVKFWWRWRESNPRPNNLSMDTAYHRFSTERSVTPFCTVVGCLVLSGSSPPHGFAKTMKTCWIWFRPCIQIR